MKDNKPMPKPGPHISGGQTPFEKITKVTRRVIQVPKPVVKKNKRKRG
jgi:hypothetical protein